MSNNTKINTAPLHVYIMENGNRSEKLRICKVGGLSEATLNKLLRGDHIPEKPVRYGIYKATGIKLMDEDDFPDLFPKVDAS